MKVKDIMSKSIISITPTETIVDASKKMKSNKISCLPVMEDDSIPIGIITTTDLVNIFSNADEQRHIDPWDKVEKFMSFPVVTIHQDKSVKEASKIMKERRFHHLIVENDEGTIIGILSSLDIARALE